MLSNVKYSWYQFPQTVENVILLCFGQKVVKVQEAFTRGLTLWLTSLSLSLKAPLTISLAVDTHKLYQKCIHLIQV